MPQPLVTIVAISYNQERYVVDALNSVKKQTYKNIQLIIADDGSKDKTKELISTWIRENWPDAIFLNHPQNQGITKNLNSALPYIKGDYYQFLGCEDILLPNKVELQVKLLEDNKEYGIVYSDMYRIDADGNFLEKTQYTFKDTNVPRSGWIYEYLLERCFISTPSALMRTEVVITLKGDNEKLQVNDYDFWLRASRLFQFLYHPDITIKYRVLTTSVSHRKGVFQYKNGFLLFYLNYDGRKPYKQQFIKRLLFHTKNLYAEKFRYGSIYFTKAFFKTGNFEFLKFAVASIPFYFTSNNK